MEIIKSGVEISRIFKEGQRINTPAITLIALRNDEQHGQCGRAAFVAGKRLGNAVWRNRAKRRMRAVCRSVNGPFEGYDVVFLAKKSVNTIEYEHMVNAVLKAMTIKGLVR